jgi:hypothetical protein
VTNFAATSATFAANVLTLTGAGGTVATLDIIGSFAPDAFRVSSDHSGGSFVQAGTNISGSTNSGITLSSTTDSPVAVTGTIDVTTGDDALYGQGGSGNSWIISNSGLINNSSPSGRAGIRLGDTSDTVTNALIVNAPGGRITGVSNGVGIYGPGTVANSAGSTIQGSVYISDVGTVVNSGSVNSGSRDAIFLHSGGLISNAAAGTVSSSAGYGVEIGKPGTVINDGVIQGAPDSVLFSDNDPSNRLIADPGAAFIGAINGGFGTLELASAASTGTLGGFGTSITNFSSLQFDPQARWGVAGGTAGLGTMTISGFAASDTIDLTDFAATSASFADNVLTLTGAGTASATLDIVGFFAPDAFHISSDGSDGSFVQVGTNISGSYNSGITLSSTADNPVAVTGTIDVPDRDAIYGQGGAGYTWTIDNFGLIRSAGGGSGRGIHLGSDRSHVTNALVVNESSGQIAGYGSGVEIYGTGTVINLGTGTIQATNLGAVYLWDVGTVENYGVVTDSRLPAVVARSGGLISNAAGGTLSSGDVGVEGDGTEAGITLTVINAGAIVGGEGALINPPETIDNLAGGTIQGLTGNGVDAFAASTIVNAGTVTGSLAAVNARSGGQITNAIGGTLSGGNNGIYAYNGTETVTNAGLVTGDNGVRLRDPGVVANSIGGVIQATRYGVHAEAGTVTNYGTIQDPGCRRLRLHWHGPELRHCQWRLCRCLRLRFRRTGQQRCGRRTRRSHQRRVVLLHRDGDQRRYHRGHELRGSLRRKGLDEPCHRRPGRQLRGQRGRRHRHIRAGLRQRQLRHAGRHRLLDHQLLGAAVRSRCQVGHRRNCGGPRHDPDQWLHQHRHDRRHRFCGNFGNIRRQYADLVQRHDQHIAGHGGFLRCEFVPRVLGRPNRFVHRGRQDHLRHLRHGHHPYRHPRQSGLCDGYDRRHQWQRALRSEWRRLHVDNRQFRADQRRRQR